MGRVRADVLIEVRFITPKEIVLVDDTLLLSARSKSRIASIGIGQKLM
jgi:hypothetical protein